MEDKNLVSQLGDLIKSFDASSPLHGANDNEKKEVAKWLKLITAEIAPALKDKGVTQKLHKVNKDLLTSVYCVSNHITVVDIALYLTAHSLIASWDDSTKGQFCNLVRHFDFIQHQDEVRDSKFALPIVEINKNIEVKAQTKEGAQKKDEKKDEKKPEPVKEEPKKEEKKEAAKPAAKEAKPAQGGKQEKGKQPAKAAKPAEPEKPMVISRLDIRVGKIVTVKRHPDADSLYVEEIDVGEEKPRTVVSGLVKFVPIEKMQDRLVCVLCNLKPSPLRGIKSEGMVLAASNADHTQVELLDPPAASKIGERVSFKGFEGVPDAQIDLKKDKVWEVVAAGLKSNGECVATWNDIPFETSAGIIKVHSISNGGIK